MMHGQLAEIFAGELAPAAPANPRIHLQRTLAITLVALFGIAPGLGHDAVELGVVDRFPGWHGILVSLRLVTAKIAQIRHSGPA
jgi:hypothetical protein